MNAEDFKRAQERTTIAKDAITRGLKVTMPLDRFVGHTRKGDKLMERTIKAEIKHASFYGFDSIVKGWRLNDKYTRELTSAGFEVKKSSEDLTEISWR